jgi:hypothetical protein
MRTRLLIGLIVALCFLGGVGSAAADSTVNYPDGSSSLALNLGGGAHAFVFFNDLRPPDIFIHPIDINANLLAVRLNNTFDAFGIYLAFETVNGNFNQYGVFTCLSFSFQTCNISSTRRGTFFISR